MATLYLVDASPYIFRAYYSLPSSLKSPDGQPTNALHGFLSFLLKLATAERPTHLAVAFDRNLNGSFRNAFYPPYKAQREAPPADLVAQIDPCLEAARVFGAASFIDDDYEADDLIATLLHSFLQDAAEHRAVVVSSDKDLAQLVSPRVELYDFAREERYDEAGVLARFGVRPGQIPDLLGLAGDPVDNIPGVAGIGKKTAAELLQAFGSLADLYARLAELPASRIRGARSLQAKLADQRESAFLSQRLATVATDAPVAAGLDDLAYRGPDLERAAAFLARVGMTRFAERLPAAGA
jgi:DNA polymerase-1